jgi:HEAT repeat protein/energy-coupling factor transporter ATP-binding protein EcfA2
MADSPRHIRIFLSSPGDVNAERALTRKVVDELHLEPLLRDRVILQTVAWDDPSARTPMLATLTPQEAINRRLPKPSECDIVVVIFWARMGTPLPDSYRKLDGSRYLSGTEWEYLDAIDGADKHLQKLPLVAIYRRTEKPQIDLSAPDVIDRYQQYQQVDKFFEQFKNADGSLRGGINQYESPAEFQTFIENDLKEMILQVLERPETASPIEPPPTAELPPSIWKGSPFPGLRAFTADDEPIFFGRDRETDALVNRVRENQFVGVVGASGSGKSSLVGAGLIPRLRGNAIDGSKDWLILQFTPGEVGDDPFMALAAKFATVLKDRPRDIAESLKKSPDALAEYGERALSGKPDWAELLLFIDQFEELFTLVRPEFQAGFIALLADDQERAHGGAPLQRRIRVVVTMRSDFYHRCVDHPALTDLLERSTYPLSVPKPSSLSQMITRPAERAGLQFEHGLPERILDDTGSDPGALALMAYLLDELYETGKGSGKLTFADYDALGGVQGAIGKRAESTFEKLDDAAQAQLKNVFRELVEVDEHGTATRRRSAYSKVAENDAARKLVDAFVEARLLVGSGDTAVRADKSTLEVAHEALLRWWPTLVEWIKDSAGDLYALRQARQATAEWDAKGRPEYLLWPHERLQPVYDALKNLDSKAEAPLDAFIRPEAERLLDRFKMTRREDEQLRVVSRWLEIGASSSPSLLAAFAHTMEENVPDSLKKVLAWWGEAIQENLRDALRNANWRIRQIATQLLTPHGDKTLIPDIIPFLGDQEWQIRQATIQFLTTHGDESLIPDIIPFLSDQKWQIRQATIQFLTTHGDESLIPDIIPFLNAREWQIQLAAILFLTAHSNEGLIPNILPLLRDVRSGLWNAVARFFVGGNGSEHIIQGAVQFLAVHGNKTLIPDLLPLLSNTDKDIRQAAVQLLTVHGNKTLIPDLLPLLSNTDKDIRQAAVQLLTVHGNKTLIPDLLPLLSNTEYGVSVAVLQALITHGDTSMTNVVLPLLDDANHHVRVAAVQFLTVHGNKTLIPDLLPLLSNTEYGVRVAVLQFLITHGDTSVTNVVLPLLNDTNHDVRMAAIQVLITHRDTNAQNNLPVLFINVDDDARWPVLQQSVDFGESSIWQHILLEIDQVANRNQRLDALQESMARGDQNWMSILQHLLDDADPLNQLAALRVLTKLGGIKISNDVLPLLRDADWRVRQAAVQALTVHGDANILAHILPLLRDAEWCVRQEAVNFLKKYGDVATIPYLLPSLADPNSGVRQAAFDALMKLSGRTLPPS